MACSFNSRFEINRVWRHFNEQVHPASLTYQAYQVFGASAGIFQTYCFFSSFSQILDHNLVITESISEAPLSLYNTFDSPQIISFRMEAGFKSFYIASKCELWYENALFLNLSSFPLLCPQFIIDQHVLR